MNASPPNIFFSLKECSPPNRLRTRFSKRSSNGITHQRDFEPQSRRRKNRAAQAIMQTGFHLRYGHRLQEPDLQQAEVNGQLATVMVPVVQHNGSEQPD